MSEKPQYHTEDKENVPIIYIMYKTMDIIKIAIGTMIGAWLFDRVCMGISWLADYPRRSRLDPGFISRIRWYEYVQRWF